MNMERNRINYGKYCILLYGERYFEQFRVLLSPDLVAATNLPHHGLDRATLVAVLYELFSSHMLVAMRGERGFFSPTLEEIEAALDEGEPYEFGRTTFYGVTSGAYDLFTGLREIYAPPAA